MKDNEANFKKMTETPVERLVITLGIPTTVSMLITSLYNMADTYFVGRLGESEQAATGILLTLQTIIQAVAFMLGHGSGTFVSKELADRNRKGASEYVSAAFFSGGAIGVIFLVFGLSFLSPLMTLLGSTDTILPHACDYGFWVFVSAPFFICSLILNNNLRYEGKAFYAMIGLTTGGLLNILLDYIFVMKVRLGVYGAGMATAISQTVSFILLLIMYFRMAEGRISFRFVSKRASVYASILKVGFPSFIRQGLTSISSGMLNNLTKPYGDSAIAAMSIVNRYSGLVMCAGLGIGQGFQPVAAFNYQVKKYRRVKRGLYFTMIVTFAIVFTVAIVGLIFADDVVALFQKEEDVIKIGVPALRYAVLGLLFCPIFVPVNMLYQSIRKAGIATALAVMRSGAVLIPVLLLLSNLFGLTGIQLAQPVSDMITGLFTIPFVVYFMKNTPDEDL